MCNSQGMLPVCVCIVRRKLGCHHKLQLSPCQLENNWVFQWGGCDRTCHHLFPKTHSHMNNVNACTVCSNKWVNTVLYNERMDIWWCVVGNFLRIPLRKVDLRRIHISTLDTCFNCHLLTPQHSGGNDSVDWQFLFCLFWLFQVSFVVTLWLLVRIVVIVTL